MKRAIIITFITLIVGGLNLEQKKKAIDNSKEDSLNIIKDNNQKLYERYCPNGGTFLQCLYKEGSRCSSLDETYCG